MSFKNMTQGGQVTLHNVRMFRQVFTVTFILTVLVGLLFFGMKTWGSYTADERYALTSYYWAHMKLSISGNKEREVQVYRHPNGLEQEVRCIDLKENKVLQYWAADFEARLIHNAWGALWVMGAIFILINGFWVWRGKAKQKKRILAGLTVVPPKVLRKILKGDASPFKLGGINLRKNTETQHLLICGTTGTGKSTCFFELAPQIRAANQHAIIVDTTGEFVTRYYQVGKDILINPFDNRTVGWNPWIDCTSPYHYDEIASAFIPQTGQDKFWSDAARTIFSETLKLHAKQGNYDTALMLRMLLSAPLEDLQNYLKDTPAASLVDPAGDRTAMSIRAHLSAYLKPLAFLPKGRPVFSIRKWVEAVCAQETATQDKEPRKKPEFIYWLKNRIWGNMGQCNTQGEDQKIEQVKGAAQKQTPSKTKKHQGDKTLAAAPLAPDSKCLTADDPQWVFITAMPDQREALRPFLTALTGSAINALMSCAPDHSRRLWFVIDELVSLHKQEAFPKALAEIRKYGGCIAVGLQDITQLQSQYGRVEAESLVSLLNTRVIFRNGHPDTARVMSQMLGEQEVREAVESISYGAHQMRDGVSLNDQNKIKPVVTPTELMSLENFEAYLKLPGNLPVTKVTFSAPSMKIDCSAFISLTNGKPAKGKKPSKPSKADCRPKTKKSRKRKKQDQTQEGIQSGIQE